MKPKPVRLMLALAALATMSLRAAGTLALPEITRTRVLTTRVDLSAGGIIVAPAAPEFRDSAERLRAHLKEIAGAEYAVRTDGGFEPAAGQVVIALGNMLNNPVLERLYWNFYTLVNPTFPGEHGFVIETVFEPLPFLPRNNVVVLGGSTPATTAEAVTAFMATLRSRADCALPPTLRVERGGEPAPSVRIDAAAKGLRAFAGYATSFHRTGDRRYLDAAMKVLDAHCEMALATPDYNLSWGDEIDSYRAACAWDFVQEFANPPDDRRLKYERFFLTHPNKLLPRTEIFGHITPGPRLAWNHSSIPLLGMYACLRYFRAHYGFAPLTPVLAQIDTYFQGQKPNYRVSEDAFYYSVFSLRPVLAYYAMTHDLEYIDNGNARKMFDLILAQVDNAGYSAGVGDSHFDPFPADDYGFGILDWRLGGLPEILWFRSQLRAKNGAGASRYFPSLQPRRPDFLAGCVAIPLDQGMYDAINERAVFRMVDQAGTPRVPSAVPLEQAFDKLQFRSFEPHGGEYLLIDGLGTGNHGHQDTGCINLAQFEGCRFLFDADYLVAKSNDHTMVSVVKDARAELPVPTLAALLHRVNFDGGAYAAVRIPKYNGTTWDRHVLWLDRRYVAVIDTLTAEEAGQFKFDCVWKVFNRGLEEFDGHHLICRAPTMAVDKIAGPPTKTFHLESVDAGWRNQRVSSEDAANWRVHEEKVQALQPGETVSFQNVFYLERADADGHRRQYTPVRLAGDALLVKSDDDAVLAVGPRKFGDLEMKTDFVFADAGSALLVNATAVATPTRTLFRSTTPATVWLHGGKARIEAARAGTLTLGDAAPIEFGAGVTSRDVGAQWTGALQAALAAAAPAVPARATTEPTAPLLPTVWRIAGQTPATAARDLASGDVDGDGRPEVLVADDATLTCRAVNDGRALWTYTHPARIGCCAVAALGAGSPIRVLLGTQDGKLVALDARGTIVKTVALETRESGEFGVRGKPWITQLRTWDLDHDGRPEVVAGLRSWQVQVFDAELKLKWYNAIVLHGVNDLQPATVPGRPDLFYAGDNYGGAYAFNITTDQPATRYRKAFTNIGATSLAVRDLNGDGVDDIICASDGGRMSAYNGAKFHTRAIFPFDEPELEPLWTFNTYGYGYSHIGLTAGANPQLVAASDSGYVSFIDARAGKFLHAAYVGEPVRTFVVLADGRIVAGTAAGTVVLLDSAGAVQAKTRIGGAVLKLTVVGHGKVAALTETGNVALFRP